MNNYRIEFTEICRPIPKGDCELHHYGNANAMEFVLIECINKYVEYTQYEISWAEQNPRDLKLEEAIIDAYINITENESTSS